MTTTPKLFHAVTGAPAGADAAFVHDLLERDAVMVPPDLRTHASMTGVRDRMAGDGAYIFLSPVRPVSSLVTFGKPTFVFDATQVWKKHGAALRIADLAGDYLQAGEYGEAEKLRRAAEDDDAIIVPQRSAEFELVARVGTQFDPRKAWALFSMIESPFASADPALVPTFPTTEEIEEVVSRCARPKKVNEFRSNLIAVVHRNRERWQRKPGFEAEVLVPARVHLREATAWSLDLKDWHPVQDRKGALR